MEETIGRWAFLVGIALAILAGLFSLTGWWVPIVLLVLGLVIGFLNVTGKESTPFLVAAVALMIVGSAGLGVFGTLGSIVEAILKNIVAIVVPAALIVALKSVVTITKSK